VLPNVAELMVARSTARTQQGGTSNNGTVFKLTLGSKTYTNLTGKKDGFRLFSDLLQARFPAGTPFGLTTDNPFRGMAMDALRLLLLRKGCRRYLCWNDSGTLQRHQLI